MGAKEPEIVPLHAGFDVVYRGFHRKQVIEHLEHLEEQFRYACVDRDEALAQAGDLRKLLEMTRHDLEDARTRVERLERSPGTTVGATERMHRMLLMAEDEANELRLNAEHEVESLRQRTEVELAERVREVEAQIAARCAEADAYTREQREIANRRAAEMDQREISLERHRGEVEAHLRARVEEIDAECAAALARAGEDADRLLRETAERCEGLEAESDAKRAKVQNFFELTMNRRRHEAEQHFAEQEELAKARAAFLIKLAAREARRRIDEIQRRTDELRELRRVVADQFAASREALEAAVGRVPDLIPQQATVERADAARALDGQAGDGQAGDGEVRDGEVRDGEVHDGEPVDGRASVGSGT
ncbi:hypothetical protein Q5530_28380 [Saccharothrix sp. BKS2]|uniref:hypothetical protein n=1 Tax=Saccharothrix sp. BKS2 TaxID=3064400 RepID=UPI0039EBDDD7